MSDRAPARVADAGDGREADAGRATPERGAPGWARSLGVNLLDIALRVPFAIRITLPFAIMAVLWFSSSRKPGGPALSVAWSFVHNSAHVVAFFGLAGAWLLALLARDRSAPVPERRIVRARAATFVAALSLAIGYGIVDELHQSYVPGRDSSVYDVVSDACGAVLAALFVFWLVRGRRSALIGLLLTALAALAGVSAATFL